MTTQDGGKENDIVGASYVGEPKDHTVMYISKKVTHLVSRLNGIKGSLIFAERGMEIPKEIQGKNQFVFTDNPQREYAEFVQSYAKKRFEEDRKRRYVMTSGGYYVGENVTIGEDSLIEPGCLIGHDVVIGRNAYIMAGVKIKNAMIGHDFVAAENAVIGAYGYTITRDSEGNKMRIPSLGKVIIGDFVEVGVCDNISVGSAGNTVIEDHVKLDALVHIGHDAHIKKNAEITAGSVVGGFDTIGEDVFVGINACIRNRVALGSSSLIGMGATVTKNVNDNEVVVGNPAHRLESKG